MAFNEGRAKRNGVIVPIQCIHMWLHDGQPDLPFHYHEYTELLFGLRGEAQVYIGSSHYVLPEGGMIIIHNHEPHNVTCPVGECEYIVVKFLPQVLRTEEETSFEYSYAAVLMENAPEKQIFFDAPSLKDTPLPGLFKQMMAEWNAQSFGYELSLRADVTLIYLYILRCWWESNLTLMKNIEKTGQGEFIRQAVSYVSEHYADLTESKAAAACNMSAAYFSRLFKRTMKTPFSVYLAKVRLKEAERLLLLTDHSVTDIANAVGFSNTSYFIGLFRKEYNSTPCQYRRQRQGR